MNTLTNNLETDMAILPPIVTSLAGYPVRVEQVLYFSNRPGCCTALAGMYSAAHKRSGFLARNSVYPGIFSYMTII